MLAERFDGVVRGMLDGRSNAYVEAMNGLLQQTKCGTWLSYRSELHCHRLPAHVQAQTSASQSLRSGCSAFSRLRPSFMKSSSTRNGIEPAGFADKFPQAEAIQLVRDLRQEEYRKPAWITDAATWLGMALTRESGNPVLRNPLDARLRGHDANLTALGVSATSVALHNNCDQTPIHWKKVATLFQ
jgi:hypothetical protein